MVGEYMSKLRHIAVLGVWAAAILLLPNFMSTAAVAMNVHPGSSVSGPFDSGAAVKLKYPARPPSARWLGPGV